MGAAASFVAAVAAAVVAAPPAPAPVVTHAAAPPRDGDAAGAPLLAVDVRGAVVRVLAAAVRGSGVWRLLCCCCAAPRRRTPRGVVPPGLVMSRTWRGVALDTAAVAAFEGSLAAAGGPPPAHRLPLLTSGLHALLMPGVIELVADAGFPFDLLGSVHMSSTVTCPDAAGCLAALASREPLTVCVAWRGADATAPHARGSVVTFTLTLRRGDRDDAPLLWTSDAAMLFFHRALAAPARAATDAPLPLPPPLVTLRLPPSLGSLWSALSGDYNPIHVHAAAAWLLGFKGGVVAHGMSVLHAASAALEAALPPAAASRNAALQLAVSFVRPTFLPTAVTVHTGGWDASDRDAVCSTTFAVVPTRGSGGKPTLTGRVTLTWVT